MSDETADVTKRVLDAGWALRGLTVTARLVDDEDSTPDAECYTRQDKDEWRQGFWSYCGVVVDVVDSDGRHWGSASLWSVHRGQFSDSVTINPLTDEYPLCDLIPEALNCAAGAISSFVLPGIIAPGDTRPVAKST